MALEQPKKPVGGAFGAFLAEKRPEFMKALEGKPISAVTTMAAEEWKKYTDAQKAPYQQKYEAAKAKYETDIAAFLAAGGEKAKGTAALRAEKRKAKEGKKAKKAKDANAPKRPAGGAYGVFINENRDKIVASLPAGHKMTDVAKAAGAQFKALSDEERKPYEDKYLQKKEEFEKAMKEYKASNPDAADEEEDGVETSPAKASPKKTGATKVAKDTPPKPRGQKRAAAEKDTTPAKRGRAAKKSEPEAPAIEAAILKEAEGLKLDGPLKNLMARPDVVACGKSQKQILDALKNSDGLVNKAKTALLGGA